METAITPKARNRLARTSLITAILSFLSFVLLPVSLLLFYYYLQPFYLENEFIILWGLLLLVTFYLSLSAIATGAAALAQIKVSEETGKIRAIIGIILGSLFASSIFLIPWVLTLTLLFALNSY